MPAQPVDGQHAERKKNPPPEIRNPEHIRDRLKKLHGLLASGGGLAAYLRLRFGRSETRSASDYFSRAAGLLNLIQGRFRKNVRVNGQCALQLTASQDLQSGAELLDNSQLHQPVGRKGIAFELLQPADIHNGVFFTENISKPALL